MSTIDDTSPLEAPRQVSHAGYSGDGVKLAFGLRWDGMTIHISEAERGSACGCTCPGQNCRRKLIAHKPESNIRHHFAHAPLTAAERKAGIAPNCQSGQMTALHRYAERLLNETKRLVLAPLTASVGARRRTIRGAKEFSFDAAKLETMDGETVPDVILVKGEHRMHVEIYVTHRCGPEKRAKIAATNISAMEIDLSGLPVDTPPERYRMEILRTAPREWIYNKKLEKLRETLEAEIKAEAERAETQRREKITKLKTAYDAAHKRALASGWNDHDDVKKVIEAGDADLLDGPSPGAGYFLVHPKVWKAATLNLLHTPFGFTLVSAISGFARRGWLAEPFRTLEHRSPSQLAEANLPTADQVLLSFLRHLAKQGVVEDQGWKWAYTQRYLDALAQRKRAKERIALDAAERASRHRRLVALVKDIIVLAGSDGEASFDFEAWLAKPFGGMGQTAKTIADGGGPEWRTLLKALSSTLAALKDESEDVGGDGGLPISEALKAARERQAARVEARRLQAEETARLERQARIDAIESAVQEMAGRRDHPWLDDAEPELGGLSPRAAAAESSDLLARTKRMLQRRVAEWKIKARALAELTEKAKPLLENDAEMLELYLKSSDHKLGGLSPRAYVKDQETMEKCLGILKERAGKR
jgi:hypothetical protein